MGADAVNGIPRVEIRSLAVSCAPRAHLSKHEIRNKSKTQSKNVQNENALPHEPHGRCLADAFLRAVNNDACAGHLWRLGATVLVIWIFGFRICFGFRISSFGFGHSQRPRVREANSKGSKPWLGGA